jgi:hypothetical protein
MPPGAESSEELPRAMPTPGHSRKSPGPTPAHDPARGPRSIAHATATAAGSRPPCRRRTPARVVQRHERHAAGEPQSTPRAGCSPLGAPATATAACRAERRTARRAPRMPGTAPNRGTPAGPCARLAGRPRTSPQASPRRGSLRSRHSLPAAPHQHARAAALVKPVRPRRRPLAALAWRPAGLPHPESTAARRTAATPRGHNSAATRRA